MIRIAIVEDVPAEQKKLQDFIEKYMSEHGQEAELFLFSDGAEFLDEYPPKLDIAFLDIEMKQVDGLRAARKVREFDSRVQLLFVTNMVQFALEGYAVDAADFIVKPVIYRSFSTRMDKLIKKLELHSSRFLMIRQGRETFCCCIQEITYIESLNKKTIIHRKNQENIYSSEPLYALEQRLENEPFFRCHNAFLVNLDYVRSLSSGDVTVQEDVVPVSKYRRKEFLNALANYRGRML